MLAPGLTQRSDDLFTFQVIDLLEKDQPKRRNVEDRQGTQTGLLLVSEQFLNHLTPVIQVKDIEVSSLLPSHSAQLF